MELTVKTISSLEKCFPDEHIDSKREVNGLCALSGETLCFQVAYEAKKLDNSNDMLAYLTVESPIKEHLKISKIENVPVNFATYSDCTDENYLRKTPGLYPDLLVPIDENSEIHPFADTLLSLWVEFEIPRGFLGGEYPIKFTFSKMPGGKGAIFGSAEFTAEVIAASLPEQELICTQWFHCDCLAEYYNVDIFSEKHWQIIENYIKCAVRNGINTILTPVFTPPLDTTVGKERPTVQLVEVFDGLNKWGFDFSKLDRWLDICDRCGVKYFEISHFFTQWGAKHAPKIMGWRGGHYVKLFGWETDATGDEYTAFLRAFIRKFLDHMRARELDKRCIFHISDEPRDIHADSYAMAKAIIADLLQGYLVTDALSSTNFYRSGLVESPIPSINDIEDFLALDIPNLWTYYCCAQHTDVSNRFIAMPLSRTRIVGAQFYKYSIAGFLHWGYNYWYSMGSQEMINPFVCTDAGRVPAGDAFSVYPAPDGSAYESIRIRSFYEAICDMRAMKLCEKLCGREAVLEAIDSTFPSPFDFKNYPKDGMYILLLRKRINSMIKDKISGTVSKKDEDLPEETESDILEENFIVKE